jgi:hypothetical protein
MMILWWYTNQMLLLILFAGVLAIMLFYRIVVLRYLILNGFVVTMQMTSPSLLTLMYAGPINDLLTMILLKTMAVHTPKSMVSSYKLFVLKAMLLLAHYG